MKRSSRDDLSPEQEAAELSLGSSAKRLKSDKENLSNARSQEQSSDDDSSEEFFIKSNMDYLDKNKIKKVISDSVHFALGDTVLTSSEEGKFIIVGRTKGKQLCHVIPVSFIEKMVKDASDESDSNVDLLELLMPILVFAARSLSGYAFTQSDLNSQEFKGIASPIRNLSDRSCVTSNNVSFLLSPRKLKHIPMLTPKKQAKAKDKFYEANSKYIKHALESFIDRIIDENTANIAVEIVARFIIECMDKAENVSFAPEGNSLRYEIRLYNDAENAQKGNKEYKVISAQKLELLYNDLECKEDFNKLIRIVNNEGAKIRDSIVMLDLLKSIAMLESFSDIDVKQYHKYNKDIVLSNNNKDLSSYNNDLNVNNIQHHIAKVLYSVFDMKALEEKVFVPAYRGYCGEKIEVYSSAKGNKTSQYIFDSGEEYRSDQINSAQGYSRDNIFRSEDVDYNMLAKKLAELFLVGVNPFASYYKSAEVIMLNALNSLIHLAALDYQMGKEDEINFRCKVHNSVDSVIVMNECMENEITDVEVIGSEYNSLFD